MPTGMLMKKIQRQDELSVIHPPRVGPRAGAQTIAMLQSPKAAARLAGGKASTSMDCSEGASPPPAIPCSTRKKMRVSRFGAIPQRKEAHVKRATQVM